MPSYEHEDGQLVVYDLLCAQATANGGMMLFSRWYGAAALLSPDDMVPLHHHPGARWEWRPVVYNRSLHGYWQGLGSQMELGWRFGLMEMQFAIHSVEAGELDEDFNPDEHFSMAEADKRADALLRENLSPLQVTELATVGKFRVRGAATRNLYRIDPGDGFELLDPVTNEVVRSYCLHPEGWMPHADVALATKLALEDEELEVETLEGARGRDWERAKRRPFWEERTAVEFERELIG